MADKMVSLRIDPELWAWLGVRAHDLQTTRTALIENALQAMRRDLEPKTVTGKVNEYVRTTLVQTDDATPEVVRGKGKSGWGKSDKLVPRP